MSTEATMKAEETNRILWVDLETTGLVPGRDKILEVAMVVTDSAFNELARRREVIKPVWWALEQMSPFVREMHAKNGLLAECAAAQKHSYEVEHEFISWLQRESKLYHHIKSPQRKKI